MTQNLPRIIFRLSPTNTKMQTKASELAIAIFSIGVVLIATLEKTMAGCRANLTRGFSEGCSTI